MIEVLKQTLDALEEIIHWYAVRDRSNVLLNFVDQNPEIKKAMQAITSLRQAIAELESQEPVAWIDLQKEAQQIVESKALWKKFIVGTPLANDIACWMADFALQHTHPPQRTWVGLTDEEIDKAWRSVDYTVPWEQHRIDIAQAIEAKLKERNT